MRKMIMIRNPNDESAEKLNCFWISFSTWITEKDVMERYFNKQYIDSNIQRGKAIINYEFCEREFNLFYGKSAPFLEVANRGINIEIIEELLNIMYSRWILREQKNNFIIEINKMLKRFEVEYFFQPKDFRNIAEIDESELVVIPEFVKDPEIIEEVHLDILTALINAQRFKTGTKDKEDVINDRVKNSLLGSRRFQIHDQTRQGESESGSSPGELDLLISTKENNFPVAVFEALRMERMAKQNLKKHIDKALIKYDPNGCPLIFIAIYAMASKFSNLATNIEEYLGEYKFPIDKVDKKLNVEDTGFTNSRHWIIQLKRNERTTVLHIYAYDML